MDTEHAWLGSADVGKGWFHPEPGVDLRDDDFPRGDDDDAASLARLPLHVQLGIGIDLDRDDAGRADRWVIASSGIGWSDFHAAGSGDGLFGSAGLGVAESVAAAGTRLQARADLLALVRDYGLHRLGAPPGETGTVGPFDTAASRVPTDWRTFSSRSIIMANPNPADGATQPDTDADFRHRPHGHDAGPDATDTAPPVNGPGVGADAWEDPGATPVVTGERKAGGVDADHPHLFHLADAPANVFDGGGLQGGHEGNWPILKGQQGSTYLARLAPGGVREPHWHPYAWEMNFVLQGRVRWTFVGPNAAQDSFEAGKGDMIFAPQGHMHYFENASDSEDLLVLIVFNASSKEPDDDIGLVHSLKAMPADVLAAVFGGTVEQFERLPGKLGRVVIASKKGLK